MIKFNALENQTVVITGASSGAGRAIALEFAKQKVKLVLAARNEEALLELAEECRKLGSMALVVVTDVSDPGAMINLANEANIFSGEINVWINNAGISTAGEFDKIPVEVHEQIIKTNLLGYIYGAHAVMPYFKDQKKGILINNISVGGFLPVPYATSYSASKFGLRGFFEALQAEMEQWTDIYICDLYPAFLDTPGIQHAGNYTGKILKPAPPVYDPARVALAAVSLARRPRKSVAVGSLSVLLKLSHAILPDATGIIMKKVMSRYFNHAKSTELTSGNVFNPLKFGTSTHGGWGLPGKPKAHRKYIIAGLLAGALSLAYTIGNKRRGL